MTCSNERSRLFLSGLVDADWHEVGRPPRFARLIRQRVCQITIHANTPPLLFDIWSSAVVCRRARVWLDARRSIVEGVKGDGLWFGTGTR